MAVLLAPHLRYIYHVQVITTSFFKREQTTLIPTMYNRKHTKEINLLSSGRFSKTFINDFLLFFYLK